MHALRTTILLGAFWLVVILSGGYMVHFRMKAQHKDLATRETKVKEELAANEELASNLPAQQAELDKVRNLWVYRSKAIPKKETSHETYEYLDNILSKNNRSTLNFDYFAADPTDTAGVRSATYKVVGESKFTDLYRFIWSIEHLPRYLRINSLQMTQTVNKGDEKDEHTGDYWVKFELSFTAMSADRPGFDEVQYASIETEPTTDFDPFRPPIKPQAVVPPNTLGLPNVFESTLRAMTPNQIYVVDQKGELKVMNLGDEVYLGRLVDISPDNNQAVFLLDKLEPPQTVSLKIAVKE
jgi:Tfp pilus assembly protein PilO